MAVGLPSGLHSRKCLDHAKNLSSALVKLSVQDVNVQRRACLALTSANATAANDSFVMYINSVQCPTVEMGQLLGFFVLHHSRLLTTEKLYDKSISCIATHSYNIYLLL